jgi:A/G-specific adenine glycosylase
MELGALICTPRAPTCLLCPVREHCAAYAAGVQERIPAARKARPTPLERRWIFCIRRGQRWLIEQRPASGRWAGMWQFVTLPAKNEPRPSAAALRQLPLAVSTPRLLGRITHGLTHRRYEFAVYACEASDAENAGGDRRWVTLAELSTYPLPRPHVKVAAMLSDTY